MIKKIKLTKYLGTLLSSAALFQMQIVLAADLQVLLPSSSAAPVGLGWDLIVNPFSPSTLILATESVSAGPSLWRVTSSASGVTLNPLDSALWRVYRMAYNAQEGALYAAGVGNSLPSGPKGSTVSSWKVLKSVDGASWIEEKQIGLPGKTTGSPSYATGITADGYGIVYVCGSASDGRVNHWIVRRRVGSVWETVHDASAKSGLCVPYAMGFVPPGANNPTPVVFAVGILNDKWTVLRSYSAGAAGSWSQTGPWPNDGSGACAYDIASDSQGNIYVAGVRGSDGNNQAWIVRMSADGGNNWTTLLDKAEGQYSWAYRLAIDAADNIWVAGAVHRPNGSPRWTVVQNSPGQAWQDSFDASDSWSLRALPLASTTLASTRSKGRGMAFDASGNMFLTGDVIQSTGTTVVGLLRLTP